MLKKIIHNIPGTLKSVKMYIQLKNSSFKLD